MDFKDKLIFLMNITQTSNKELAKGISVDPSLISLLRSGKRKQPQNVLHIKNMALFFAKRCNAGFQRNALSEMLGQISLRSDMPAELLANRIENWLKDNEAIVVQMIEGIEDSKRIKPLTENAQYHHNLPEISVPVTGNNTTFYYNEEGRRIAMQQMMKVIHEIDTPCSILIVTDDNLEWLLSDYMLSKQLQSDLMEILKKGFTLYQIMPAMNFLPRYTESLQFWLPMYSTGQMKVYYYPRIRDNLHRHSTIIVPEHVVQTSTSIGLGPSSHINLFSTDPELIKAYTEQFYEYLSLCRPALNAFSDPKDFIPCILDIFSRPGATIQMVEPLSVTTLPRELLERCITEVNDPVWKTTYQLYMDEIPHFEKRLTQEPYIDICRLASADEVRSGKVFISSTYETSPDHPRYTPETYILHLKNIIRLMDQYENYYFLPSHEKERQNYNLIAIESGLALLIHTSDPPLLLEIQRPEMVLACREYLLRKAEKKGYDGIHKTKIRIMLEDLIQELQG